MHHKLPQYYIAGLVGILLALGACAHGPDAGSDREVAMRLTNGGSEPLRCSIVFGHWVYRELGALAPGQTLDIPMIQAAKDGALYINRFDGQRQMMIENVLCGSQEAWRDSVGQIDLTAIRSTRVSRVAAECATPMGGGRVACRTTEVTP